MLQPFGKLSNTVSAEFLTQVSSGVVTPAKKALPMSGRPGLRLTRLLMT